MRAVTKQLIPDITKGTTYEPVVPIIMPLTIGPIIPPQFDAVFCMPPNTDVILRGAISPGKLQIALAAKDSPA